MWQVVVGENQIRPDHSVRHQFQRSDTVWRRDCAIAFAFQEYLEQLAHLGVILDGEDRAGVVNLSGRARVGVLPIL